MTGARTGREELQRNSYEEGGEYYPRPLRTLLADRHQAGVATCGSGINRG